MSVQASATLFFGTFIRLRSLVCAARAWQARDIRATDMILRRRGRGTLRVDSTAGRTTCANLPTEIWHAVMRELLDHAVQAEVGEVVSSVHYSELNEEQRADKHLELPTTLSHLDDCAYCWEAYQNSSMFKVNEVLRSEREVSVYLSPAFVKLIINMLPQTVNSLLLAFDLALAGEGRHFYSEEPPDDIWDRKKDIQASCAVALPSQINRPTDDSADVCEFWPHRLEDGDRADAVGKIDPRLFNLPHDAQARFTKLLDVFPILEAVQPASYTLGPPALASSNQSVNSAPLQARGSAITPGWHLWTSMIYQSS